MTIRKILYSFIKELSLQEEVKRKTGVNYTLIPNHDLFDFVVKKMEFKLFVEGKYIYPDFDDDNQKEESLLIIEKELKYKK